MRQLCILDHTKAPDPSGQSEALYSVLYWKSAGRARAVERPGTCTRVLRFPVAGVRNPDRVAKQVMHPSGRAWRTKERLQDFPKAQGCVPVRRRSRAEYLRARYLTKFQADCPVKRDAGSQQSDNPAHRFGKVCAEQARRQAGEGGVGSFSPRVHPKSSAECTD